MPTPPVLTDDDRRLLSEAFAERERLVRDLRELSNRSLAEKFECSESTIRNEHRRFEEAA